MNNHLSEELLKLIAAGAPAEEIEKVSRELLEQKTPLEKAEVAQILEEVKAGILARRPPPKATLYV